MTEFTTIKIERFRDPAGAPTCCRVYGERQCKFLGARHFGTVDLCRLTGADLYRSAQGQPVNYGFDGWVRPADGCPVWADEVAA